jgi:hypothetical protein
MRYLLDKTRKDFSLLWLSLVNKIADAVNESAVLYGQKRTKRRFIKDLFFLLSNAMEGKTPLFDDGDLEQIISQQYEASDFQILRDYGLSCASFNEVI